MENLKVSEIKSFVPAKDFDLSKRFYQSIGFEVMSEFHDIAYLR
ncbi:glyoxalase, partial [Vibrio sp. 10N.222.51.A6]